MSKLLAFGLGYSARVLAQRLTRDGWSITGTSRTAEVAGKIDLSGWHGIVFDGTRPSPDVSKALAATTHILLSVPPGQSGDPVLIHHGAEIAASQSVRWIGYLSTVGVYGDHQGRWVDETTPATPGSDRARRRLAAELAWLDLATGNHTERRVTIFRLPGIYGPGRSAIDSLLCGTARRIIKPGQVFNRIHVDDLATALTASMSGQGTFSTYNIADNEPCAPEDVTSHAAVLLGLTAPPAIPFEAAELSPMARSFYAESKRVSNRRLRSDLNVELGYPTYREGLAAIVATR